MQAELSRSTGRSAAPLIEAVWSFFASPRTALALAGAACAAAGAGLSVDAAALPRLATVLELYAPLRSWWLELLLTLLWLNLLALVLDRVPRRREAPGIIGAAIASASLLVGSGAALFDRLAGFEGQALVPAGARIDSMVVRTPDRGDVRRRLGFFIGCEALGPAGPELQFFERLSDGSAGRRLARRSRSGGVALRHGGLIVRDDGVELLDFQGMPPVLAARLKIVRSPALPVVYAAGVAFLLGIGLSLAERGLRRGAP